MNKRGTGAIFCLASSILFSAQYIVVVMHTGTNHDIPMRYVRNLLRVGTPLLLLGLVSLCVGIWYIVTGEVEEKKLKENKDKEDE